MSKVRQKDIIWLDFDPSSGREIQKRRPALVLSNDRYNSATGFAIVMPIGSSNKTNPAFFNLAGYKTGGQINTTQVYSFDVNGNRNPQYIERLRDEDFLKIHNLFFRYI